MKKNNYLKKSNNGKSLKKKVNRTTDGKLEINDTFFLSFVGELVEIAGSFYHGEAENAIKTHGYILDIDDEFYYLGDTPEEVTQALRRDRVIYIQVLTPANEYREILDQLEVPEDETAKN
jgi:hypothetical protein